MNQNHFVAVSALLLSACNFHIVEDGRVYRMGQPSAKDIRTAVNELGIKTILNLRGEAPGRDWYDAEVRTAREMGIDLVNVGLSASKIPSKQRLLKVIDTFRNAAYPILIHCKAGADRTGWVSALYQMTIMGKSKKKAVNDSLRKSYLHFKEFTPAPTYFMSLYQGEEWARHVYDPCTQDYRYFDRNSQCGEAAEAPVSVGPLAVEEDT